MDMSDSIRAAPQVNLVSGICWLYALLYLLIAALKIIRAVYKRHKLQDQPIEFNGAWFFLMVAFFLFWFPYLNTLFQGRIYDSASQTPLIDAMSRSEIVKWVMISMWFMSPFFPWLMMAINKKNMSLRKQGRYGIYANLVPFCIYAILLILR